MKNSICIPNNPPVMGSGTSVGAGISGTGGDDEITGMDDEG